MLLDIGSLSKPNVPTSNPSISALAIAEPVLLYNLILLSVESTPISAA